MVLTFTELDNSCQNAIANMPAYYGQCVDGLILLYQTGCRPNEIFEVSMWSDYSPTQLSLQPLKANSTRYFNKSDLNSDFVNAVILGAKWLNAITPRQLEYSLKAVYEYSNPRKGNKDTALYLYRYRYMKFLSEIGESDADIQTAMGIGSLAVAQDYINASIEVD